MCLSRTKKRNARPANSVYIALNTAISMSILFLLKALTVAACLAV